MPPIIFSFSLLDYVGCLSDFVQRRVNLFGYLAITASRSKRAIIERLDGLKVELSHVSEVVTTELFWQPPLYADVPQKSEIGSWTIKCLNINFGYRLQHHL